MNPITIALVVDLITLTVCTAILLKAARLSAMHPATTYLFFHVWTVTKRLIELNLGAPLSTAFPHQPINLSELTRAGLMFDLTLAVMTAGWLIASAADAKKNGPLPLPGREKAPNLSKTYLVGFVWLMVPLALFGMLRGGGGGPAADAGVGGTVLGVFNLWLPLSLMPLFYWYGPRPGLIAAALVVIALCEKFMGNTRWLMLLPTIFFCFAYLSRSGYRWPPRKVVFVLLIAGVLWLPGKQISVVLGNGGGLPEVMGAVTRVWTTSATESNHPDNQFLDMGAMTLSLVDDKRKFYYGGTVFPFVYNFIPRAIWPDKPLSSQWEIDISTKDRPMMTYGMTASLMGAAYVDFGVYGVVLIPFLFALFLGWVYFKAFRCAHYSVGRFAYLVMACVLIQPYRDGLYTFFIFNYLCMMPMYMIVLLHLILPTKPYAQRPRYPRFPRLSPADRSPQPAPSRPAPVPQARRPGA